MSSVAVIVLLAGAAWVLVKVVARVQVAVATVRKRSYLIWIALAVVVAISFAARR